MTFLPVIPHESIRYMAGSGTILKGYAMAGLYDGFQRDISYLRISVTDRCNLRCIYCMPSEGIPLVSHNDILSFEEILLIVQSAVELGIDKIRITGGEPLVRSGIVDLVQMISTCQGC